MQGVVELALSKVADHSVRVFCSGRTDAGVHAKEQVIHFETDSIRDSNAWLFGGNVNLPSDVNFNWVKEVSDGFHAGLMLTLDYTNIKYITTLYAPL